ncbi:CHRD domain-containing protein [Schinkia azotoformans MEV2011]|uniref:CHRD domain-containing protein n=1 Tax=Schinkia azotoformans MEV2011 TaxID=1348973 RepID=A0A072NLJ3_SCHAZ|nr:CHRD domain-containing protein [Schinkia azotoformans]KEF38549.1 CHRD domain-containing protein [Schinkia azotoformans MEV2011]MEC1695157.1 CHRD domain-containing protein [Schinkia azotoformans]MEC1717598.1 CHRD domain-containing protein [Schinkia azotoformans]MEC1723784.1 CHRD domain-containing protein [Schinkia azotoformans]MEC1742335.1 CHRD domain-containing protein [Schinkia azotoformans]
MNRNELFFANLSGSEEVPPVETNATGLIKFKVSSDRQRIGYKLTVNKLANFTEAHIHLGHRRINGPVVVFLFGPIDPNISVNKGVVEGVITADDLVGPLQGASIPELLRLIRAGRAYVNVNTAQHPNGEIRGQIRRC